MAHEIPEWGQHAAAFLAENLPREDDGSWYDMASTAYQIGCMAMVQLGYADERVWGAMPKPAPVTPEVLPRWDDVCIAVLWLAEQQNILSYRMPDGGVFRPKRNSGFVVSVVNAPPPPSPNIGSAFGSGPACCDPWFIEVLGHLDLVRNGSWSQASELVHWRTLPGAWGSDFREDRRFVQAVETAIRTIPDDIMQEMSNLMCVSQEDIAERIASQAQSVAETKARFGPKARINDSPLTPEQAHSSIVSANSDGLDWLFFRRWRITDGWLSGDAAKAAIHVFHDPLAIAMRKEVIGRLFPNNGLGP